MLFYVIYAVLLCQTVVAMPPKSDETFNDFASQEFTNFIQKLGLGPLMNGSEKLTVSINGNNVSRVMTDKGVHPNKTIGKSLLIRGQNSLGQVESMIRRARNIFTENLSKDILPSEFKNGGKLTTDVQQPEDSSGQNPITVNYHYSPTVLQLNFYNMQPFGSRNPCDPNPCQNGGICHMDGSGRDYYCKCPNPMGGKNCSDIYCGGEHCFQFGDTVLFVYNDQQITFINAKHKCQKKNMDLVKIPDEDKNENVRRALLKMYKDDHTSQHCFFNGLYRSTANGNFHWTDGSPLGSYRPWADGKLEGQCVVLCTTKKFNFYWDIDPCNGEDKRWEYYYMCERKLSF